MEILNVNDEIVLDIKRLGINGEGIGYYKKLAVFVKNAIPGEGLKVVITKVLPKMAYGEIVASLHASKNRIEPKCPYYGDCGGCQIEHIEYTYGLSLKRELVVEAITRYTTLNPRSFEIKNTIGMENPWNYRNKSSLLVKNFEDGYMTCMIKADSNIFLPIEKCLVHNEIINKINVKVMEFVTKYSNEGKIKKGNICNLVTRVSVATGDVLVCLILRSKEENIRDLGIELVNISNVKGVYQSINPDKKSIDVFGPTTELVIGDKTITEQIGNLKYKLLPNTFFQLNSIQTKTLYDEIKKACKLSMKETVIDAYCGVGTIGLYLAKMAKNIIGIEYDSDAVEAANRNAKLNKITNANFRQGDTVELLPQILKKEEQVDVIVVDPPRVGLGEKLTQVLAESNVKRIVYVSCNPATLAKDLNVLTEKYQIKYIQPIDMFPQTAHVETVVLLSRK